MTVKELIEELEKIDNKDLDVIFHNAYGSYEKLDDVYTGHGLYGKTEHQMYVVTERECVLMEA